MAAWEYAGDWDESEQVSQGQSVVLRNMPATLWLAARQHHDALLRELALYCATHDDVAVDFVAADTARTGVSECVEAAIAHAQREGVARTPLPPGHPSPLPEVPDELDLTLPVPAEEGRAYAALQDALDQAEDLAVRGLLLARPELPEIVAVRDRACEQVIAQLAGAPPLSWPGTDQERFEVGTNDRARPQPPRWDASIIAARLAVWSLQTTNRIIGISRPLAHLLGWEPDDLVGRRVVTIIPPRLGEAHVAGFQRPPQHRPGACPRRSAAASRPPRRRHGTRLPLPPGSRPGGRRALGVPCLDRTLGCRAVTRTSTRMLALITTTTGPRRRRGRSRRPSAQGCRPVPRVGP
jgi:PAS domain-containing protein